MNHEQVRMAWRAALLVAVFLGGSLRAGESGRENGLPEPVLKGALDYSAVEAIAIQEQGRKKPLHTFAIETLEQVTGKPLFAGSPYFSDTANGEKVGTMDLFLSLWLTTREWAKQPVVLVSYGKLREAVGLAAEEKRFSPEQLLGNDKLEAIYKEALRKRHENKEEELSNEEREAELVHSRIELLGGIISHEALDLIPHPTQPNGTWLPLDAFFGLHGDPDAATEDIARLKCNGDAKRAQALLAEYQAHYKPEQVEGLQKRYGAFIQAYYRREPAAFEAASWEFRNALAALSPTIYPSREELEREVTYNHLRPFGKAWMFYFAALVLGMLTFKARSKAAWRAVVALFACGLAFHVYGFVLRCLIAGRPPVSNMYESVIWVGFGIVFFASVFELVYKPRYYLLSGAGGGTLCLVLMDLLPVLSGNAAMPGFESKISPLVPVLRDNFWLTVHVLTITLSYAAFALAWVLGHATLYKHLFQPQAKAEQRQLHQFIYRVLQVGVLLLATGTILGGVWANYSWGRFWGWDPKETWAFIALLCYLVVLHGRFTGWWGNFGMSVGSVLCFQAVVMAWYGVNFVLGKGLHSYGFGSDSGKYYVYAVVALDLAFTLAAVVRYLGDRGAARRLAGAQPKLEAQSLTGGDPVDEARAV